MISEQQFPTFDSPEQRRVIEDIASWKNEGRRGKLRDDELHEYIRELSELDTDELEDLWFQTVGRWVLSRHDIAPGFSIGGPDEWLADQFHAVKIGTETEYGYVRGVSLLSRRVEA